MTARRCFAFAFFAALSLSAAAFADDFVSLVHGDDAEQFQLVGINSDTIKIVDGVIQISGKPAGYFATKASYHNYILEFDWMYERPAKLESDAKFNGNSGLLIHITGEAKVWPKCVEVQLANADAGNIFAIGGAKFQGKKDAAAQKKAIKPVGEWNREEVTCDNGTIVCKINDVEVARGKGSTPDQGQIGWQSEGGVIKFRNVKIKKLD